MGYKEERKILFHASFAEAEKNRLSTLRRILTEEGRHLELIEYRRLHIVGWLVTTG